MPEPWTGELIGKMHNAGVTYDELGAELNVSKSYVSMILNGRRTPTDAEAKFNDAFVRVVEKKGVKNNGS